MQAPLSWESFCLVTLPFGLWPGLVCIPQVTLGPAQFHPGRTHRSLTDRSLSDFLKHPTSFSYVHALNSKSKTLSLSLHFFFFFRIPGCVLLAKKAKTYQTFSPVVLFICFGFLLGGEGSPMMKTINVLKKKKTRRRERRIVSNF